MADQIASDRVRVERRGDILVIGLNSPPVNGLGHALRCGIDEGLTLAASDDAIGGVVIAGEGRMFSAGADISEFGTPKATADPKLTEICLRIENFEKPVVAAFHGVAAGGGLELALSCHRRIATRDTKLGLPEVTLGIIPGAGGTQRLPRLIGVEKALDHIVTGALIPAAKAVELGFVDALADGDVVDAGCDDARRLASEGGLRRTMALEDKIAAARGETHLFDDYARAIARKARGFDAPFACIEAVKAAVELPGPEGLKREREIFLDLLGSPKAAAQRYAFFAEREAAKVDGVPRGTEAAKVASAAVIGCGTMGGGIAMVFANAGIPVTVIEKDTAALENGMERIRGNYAGSVSRGRMTPEAMERHLSLITPATDLDSAGEADIVVEAVFEEMDLKKSVFRALDGIAKPGAVLATNTSMLDVNVIAAETSRPEAVIGTHFFSPANVMKLLEVVRGDKTAPETIATVMALARTLGKVAVVVGVCDGFVGNRMLWPYFREAEFLLEEGAMPDQVDRAIFKFGFPMGPFAMSDMAGNDVSWRIRQRKRAENPSNDRYSDIADKICEMGRFGQKTGAGWYHYADGRTPEPDAAVTNLILETSRRLGITRRVITDEEIVERCLFPLINEGARLLEEGIAQRASDIDVVWLYGYGWPRYRGGPMHYADAVGLDLIYEKMCAFHDWHGALMEPAPLLAELAKSGGKFADYTTRRV